jgi:outer membrane protein, multidrug efflux system
MKAQVRQWLLMVIASAGLLAGCAVGPEYKRPTLTPPETFRGHTGPAEAASLADLPWWEVFRDPTLQALVQTALANNYDLRVAVARVEEARAFAAKARGAFVPAIGYGGNIGRARGAQFGSVVVRPGQPVPTENAFLGLVTASFQSTYDLFQRRLGFGLASTLETSRAEGALGSAAETIPDLERQIAAKENESSVLLGRNPGPIPRGPSLFAQPVVPAVPAGLPSALLERRPDLRQAEQQLVQANAQVGVAKADFFPRIVLSGFGGGVSPQLSAFSHVWSLTAGLTGPIFQGGQIRANYQANVAAWEQAKLQYEQAVLTAFQDVSSALTALEKLAQAEAEQARAVNAYADAVQIATRRYRGGLASYYEVLEAQQLLFPAETQLAQVRASRLSTYVQLYKVLGGGWTLTDAQWSGPQAQRQEQ